MSFCWSGFPAPFPGSVTFPALAGPVALFGAPGVLPGDASAPAPAPQPRPGADADSYRDDAGAGDAKGGE
jgi:hypothetical protein